MHVVLLNVFEHAQPLSTKMSNVIKFSKIATQDNLRIKICHVALLHEMRKVFTPKELRLIWHSQVVKKSF